MEAVSVAECADIVKPRNKQRSILFIRWKLYRLFKKRATERRIRLAWLVG